MSPASTPQRICRLRWRQTGRWLLGALVGLGILAGVWLAQHGVPRSVYLSESQRAIAAVDAAEELPTPDGYRERAVSLRTVQGMKVDFRVLRPGGEARPRPLVVLLAGHRTGRDAIRILGDPGGIVVAALDYPYSGPEKIRGVRQALQAVPVIQQALLDTPSAVSVALDWLLRQPWVDPKQVELMGVSLGAPFAAAAGAQDERFRRVWLVHGADDTRAWLANRLERKIARPALREGAATVLHLLAYGPSFAPDRWVPKIAPRSVVVIGAAEDEQMPRSSVEGLFALAGEPRELLWSEGGHVHTDRLEIVRQLLEIVRARILEGEGA